MAYRFFEGNQFHKGLRSVRKQEHLVEIRDEVEDIVLFPLKETEPLVGNLAIPGLRYRKIRNTSPEYRILFRVFDCAFETVAGKPFCEHDKCKVGVMDIKLASVEGEETEKTDEEGIFPVQQLSDTTACEGLIKFAIFGPRQLFNNLYKLHKKDLEKMLR